MEEKFKKGDIVRNIYAGEHNPTRYMLYIGKCTINHGKTKIKGYKCIDYTGMKAEVVASNDPLVKVSHMKEFDAFIKALKMMGENNEPSTT